MLRIKYLVLFLFVSSYAMVQVHGDRVSPLHSNPVLIQKARANKRASRYHKITPPPPNPIKNVNLPFLDDFSKPGPYPDPNLWQNNNVFVNYTYPICPHTLGVATLDGVDGIGQPYNPNCPLNGSYPADTLTSQHIKLGNYNLIGDSIYFSFYYQPGGLGPIKYGYGSSPKYNDTLVLEFFNGVQWNEVWYHTGYTAAPNDTNFHYVLIPVVDSQYFINGFQFRFRNYANTSGNLDHWNIDEVYMGAIRNYKDSSQYDVSFVYESPSLLNSYEFMPWEQLTSGDLRSNFNAFMRNNDTLIIKPDYSYDSIPGFLKFYYGGTNNDPPFYTTGYVNYPPHSNPPLSFEKTALSGPATYNFTQFLTTPASDFDKWNDTLRFNQVFSDYYAYDDGTAEVGYSVLNTGAPTYLACQYTLNKADTLVGVYIFFNYVLNNASGATFRLAVWNDGGGHPGTMIHEEDTITSPKYDSLDQFVYYPLHFATGMDTMLNSGTFYIGWEQTSTDSINVGFDWNDNNQYKIFYNLSPTGNPAKWSYCSYQGSVMIRPVFAGKHFNPVQEIAAKHSSVQLYPNPATDIVNILPAQLPNTLLRIYTVDGKLISEDQHFSGNQLNTSNLPQGFYIVEISPQNGQPLFQKLLISR